MELQAALNRLAGTSRLDAQGAANAIAGAWGRFDNFTVGATTTAPTLGTGGSTTGKYIRIGSMVVFHFIVAFGSSGANAGEGFYKIPLPVTGVYMGGPYGTSSLVDSSAGAILQGNVCMDPADQSGDYCFMVHYPGTPAGDFSDRLIGHNLPWAWGANDQFLGTLTYEAA